VSDALFRARNVGIGLSGSGFGGHMSWSAGVFNDWFDASQRLDESATQIVGRVTSLAWATADDSHLLHLGLGARYSGGKEGFRYRAAPEFNQSPLFVDTGPLEAESAFTSDLEVSWRRGPFWVAAEFLRSRLDAPPLGNPVFSGFDVSASWVLTREMRPYNRRNGTLGPVPVSRSVYQGGPGAWELAARYSSIDLSDGPAKGGEMNILSLGLN
jgi:phosphate-selective porin OprO/OprP